MIETARSLLVFAEFTGNIIGHDTDRAHAAAKNFACAAQDCATQDIAYNKKASGRP